MKKIGLRVTIKDINGNPLLNSSEFDFIFGIGTTGLAPLEYLIEGKCQGDEVQIRVENRDITHIFGHIPPPFSIESIKIDTPFIISIEILSVSTPEDREVIRALADIANCGEHCCCT